MIKGEFCSSKISLIVVAAVVIPLWLSMVAFCVYGVTLFQKQSQFVFEEILSFIVILAFTFVIFPIVCIYGLNKSACIVWMDETKNELCRRGLFYGYKYGMKVDKITYIIKIHTGKLGTAILVTDSESKVKKDVLKQAILLEPNRKNIEFIEKVFDIKYEEIEYVYDNDFKHGDYDGTFIR